MFALPPLVKIARRPSADGPRLVISKVGSVPVNLHQPLIQAKSVRDRAVLK
jgi:hypothetical protein